MENHLYECIYDVLQRDPSTQNIRPILNRLKAKIVRLHSIRMQRLLLDTEEANRLESERPTLYHTLQMKRRRSQRTIHYLRDENGQLQTTPRGIAFTMTSHFRKMYDIIEAESDSVKTLMDEVLKARINQYGEPLRHPLRRRRYKKPYEPVEEERSLGRTVWGKNSTKSIGH